MSSSNFEIFDKIRKQFDFGPYPRIPLEKTPKDNSNRLYNNNLTTSYYCRNHRIIPTEGKIILDVGCGSGYTTLVLAEANPGSQIVGFDISATSIELAKQRLAYHGFNNVEFYVMSIEEVVSLDFKFDYINCEEVLYLIPNVEQAFENLKLVLQPDGLIRANLHNATQRRHYYNAQKLFSLMGLMDDFPENMGIEFVKSFMNSLRDDVILKSQTWNAVLKNTKGKPEEEDEVILANYLLRGDRGYTMSDVFRILEVVNLEFISMVNWHQWNLLNLFQEPDDLPAFISLALQEATPTEKIQMVDLLHPMQRLLDFWCGHPGQGLPYTPIEEWTDTDWQTCRVHLHPLLRTQRVADLVNQCLREYRLLPMTELLKIPGQEEMWMESTFATCIIPPLLESSLPISSLIKRWQQIRPLNVETLEPITSKEVLNVLKQTLINLEQGGYVLLEQGW